MPDEYDVVILGANHFQIGRYQLGAGYRFLELALALADHGVRAAIVSPGPTDFVDPPVPVLDQSAMSYDDISASARVFVFCLLEDHKLVELLRRDGKTLIYDSFLSPVEQLTYPRVVALGDPAKIHAHFREAVRKHNAFNAIADCYLVGEVEEKLLKLGELISTDQVAISDYRTLGDRIFPLPVCGFSRHTAPRGSLAATSDTMLWNGGLWNHYGGTDLIIDAVKAARADGRDLSFHFLYPNDKTAAYARIKGRIAQENLPYIQLGLPGGRHPDYFEKQEILRGCRATVLLYESVLQLHLFVSMRLRETLLFEKPIIASAFGVQGAFVARHGIGLTIDNTVASLRAAMERLSTDTALYDRLVDNIRRLKADYEFERYVPAIARVVADANR
jgi:hypothetical protein